MIFLVHQDDDFDVIHVHFRVAERGDYVAAGLTDEQAALEARRTSKEEIFSEYWSFVRRGDAKGPGKLSRGMCSNCGAPVEQTPTATCGHCGAVLNSGTYDWVLAKISRERSLDRTGGAQAEGFAELKARDPAINRHVLEDKASLVFWKWVEARVVGRPHGFARFCTPVAYETARDWEGKSERHLFRVAIISMDVVQVRLDADLERIWFRLRWKYWRLSVGWQLRSDFLQLARKAGSRTNPGRGMATERCHQCAAPQTERDTVSCEYCGALLTEDWAFVDLVGPKEFMEQTRGDTHGSPAALV